MNVLLDEVSPPPETWSRAPRYVSIALTNACELSCPFCYASKAPAQLKFDTVVGWSKELDEAGCFGIGFGGGEPTLYPRFAELCRSVYSETGLAVTFTTHGHRFTPKLVDALSGSVSFIRLSMDGLGVIYESLRGRSFSVFEEKLQLVRATAAFGINFVINEQTIDSLPAVAEFALNNGAYELLLLPQTGSCGRLMIGAEMLQELSEWIQSNHQRVRLATSAHAIDALDVPRLPVGSTEESTFDFMHVNAFGVLKRTAFDRGGLQLTPHTSIMAAVEELRIDNQMSNCLQEEV